MKQNKKASLQTALLQRITDFQLQSIDVEFFNECENIRQFIVDYFDGNLPVSTCEKCGCNELLCGHNKRK
jgi:hypothetical protein